MRSFSRKQVIWLDDQVVTLVVGSIQLCQSTAIHNLARCSDAWACKPSKFDISGGMLPG